MVIIWTLPLNRPAVGVRVTAGTRGDVIGARQSDLWINGSGVPHRDGMALATINAEGVQVPLRQFTESGRVRVPTPGEVTPSGRVLAPLVQLVPGRPILAARCTPTTDIQVRLHLSDLLAVVPSGRPVTVTAHVTHADGSTTRLTRLVGTDAAPPTGAVTVHLTPLGAYVAYYDLSEDTELLRVQVNGQVVDLPVPPGGGADVLLAEAVQAAPSRVTGVDTSGNEGEDLLLLVTREAELGGETALATWPLTSDLNPNAPVTSRLLAAWASALDVRPERAGDQLHLLRAEPPYLARVAAMYGVQARLGETDGDLVRRSLAVLTPRKSTLKGLEAMVRAEGLTGITVMDARTDVNDTPLTFDGSWTFDGSRTFNGGNPDGFYIPPGVVVGVIKTPTYYPLSRPLAVLNRYVAAGVVARVRLDVRVPVAVPKCALSAQMHWRFPVPLSRLTFQTNAEPLTFDGSWSFDGTQSWIGWRTRSN